MSRSPDATPMLRTRAQGCNAAASIRSGNALVPRPRCRPSMPPIARPASSAGVGPTPPCRPWSCSTTRPTSRPPASLRSECCCMSLGIKNDSLTPSRSHSVAPRNRRKPPSCSQSSEMSRSDSQPIRSASQRVMRICSDTSATHQYFSKIQVVTPRPLRMTAACRGGWGRGFVNVYVVGRGDRPFLLATILTHHRRCNHPPLFYCFQLTPLDICVLIWTDLRALLDSPVPGPADAAAVAVLTARFVRTIALLLRGLSLDMDD